MPRERDRQPAGWFDGIVPPDTVALASAAILAVMDGLQVQWLLDPGNVDLAKASEFAIEAIVASVLEPRASILAEDLP